MMAAAMDHIIEVPGRVEMSTEAREDLARTTVICGLRPGQQLRIVKFLAYGWSSLRSRPALRDQVGWRDHRRRYTGWEGLLDAQREYLDDFWDCADVEVEGDAECQQAVRFGLFHVLQASARAERRAIAGKGLTGTGYDGHAFWDTEGFVLPVLTYTAPRAAADALRWRASTLDLARERAAELDLAGAAFPWRTIRGQECSAYWPAGTAAWHVNADIAMAFERYRIVTGDESLEAECGLEVLVETARMWSSLGHHDRHGVWHIDGVTGPDEYTAVVRDNVFTNLMAAANLRFAAQACERHPEIAVALEVTAEETASWRAAADAVHIPFDDELRRAPAVRRIHQAAGVGVHRGYHYPLLLHEPYVRLYPSQVVKQADLVLAMHWSSHAFSAEEKARNVDYYERRTTRTHHCRPARRPCCAPRWATSIWLTTTLRGRPDRPARPASQHPRRAAHGIAGGSVDRLGRRVRWIAGGRRRARARSCASRRAHPPQVPVALEGLSGHGRRQSHRRQLCPARRPARSIGHQACG